MGSFQVSLMTDVQQIRMVALEMTAVLYKNRIASAKNIAAGRYVGSIRAHISAWKKSKAAGFGTQKSCIGLPKWEVCTVIMYENAQFMIYVLD